MNQSDKQKRRKPSAWPSVMSLALVMFILSLWGVSILAFDVIVKTVVEGNNLDIYFTDQTTEEDISKFIAEQKKSPEIKKMVYISQKEALDIFMNNEDNKEMAEFITAETLPKNIELYFKASEDMNAVMSKKAKELKANPLVDDVHYNPKLIETVSHNIRIAQYILLGSCLIFIIIAIGLIQSSTRLSIFAKRFIIKSMQLLGATNAFIIKPFITKYIGYASFAFLLSLAVTLGIVGFAYQTWPEMGQHFESVNYAKAALIFGSIALFGVLLAIICVWLSTRKYLRTKIENLY